MALLLVDIYLSSHLLSLFLAINLLFSRYLLVMNLPSLNNIQNLSIEDKEELLTLLDELQDAKARQKCSDNFLNFVKDQWLSLIHI